MGDGGWLQRGTIRDLELENESRKPWKREEHGQRQGWEGSQLPSQFQLLVSPFSLNPPSCLSLSQTSLSPLTPFPSMESHSWV